MEKTKIMTSKIFHEFILKADILTQEHNGLTLGSSYMKVLEDSYPEIYKDIKGTDLDTSIHREHIPMLFLYLTNEERS